MSKGIRGVSETHVRLVFGVKVVPDGRHLAALEGGDLDRPPAFAGAGHRREHQLERRPFAERMGKHLQAPAPLKEQPLEKVRGPDRLAVFDWHPEMGNARFEVILEALDGARKLIRLVPGHVLDQFAQGFAGTHRCRYSFRHGVPLGLR